MLWIHDEESCDLLDLCFVDLLILLLYLRFFREPLAAVDDEGLHCGISKTVLPSTMLEMPEGMTKTQWKKQLRQQRRMLAWEKNK